MTRALYAHGVCTPSMRRRAVWELAHRTARGETTTPLEPLPMLDTSKNVLPIRAASESFAQDAAEVTDAREAVRLLIDSGRRLSQAVVAKEIGISSAVLSQWLSNSYPGRNDLVDDKARAWLASYRERQSSSGLPVGPDWIETPSSERALAAFRYAQMAADMVVVYGGAGTGKTKAIEHYKRLAPSVFHVTMSPASHSVNACMVEIAEALGMREYPQAGAKLFRAIVARLLNTNGLLVVDEAQHLGVSALDQVRSIHDATRVGVALVGNEQVYGRMTGGTRAAYLDRLFSRIGKRVFLKKATEGDVDSFMAAWGITDRDCRRQIHDIASRPGALRVLNKVLRLAASHAQAGERPLCCADVRAAWAELGGLE